MCSRQPEVQNMISILGFSLRPRAKRVWPSSLKHWDERKALTFCRCAGRTHHRGHGGVRDAFIFALNHRPSRSWATPSALPSACKTTAMAQGHDA